MHSRHWTVQHAATLLYFSMQCFFCSYFRRSFHCGNEAERTLKGCSDFYIYSRLFVIKSACVSKKIRLKNKTISCRRWWTKCILKDPVKKELILREKIVFIHFFSKICETLPNYFMMRSWHFTGRPQNSSFRIQQNWVIIAIKIEG